MIKPKLSTISFFIILSFTGILFCLGTAKAHKAVVYAYLEGQTVHVEAKYSQGRRILEGRVSVLDASQNMVFEGRTDSKGQLSFTLPGAPPLDIVLEDGTGHRATWRIVTSMYPPEKTGSPPKKKEAIKVRRGQEAVGAWNILGGIACIALVTGCVALIRSRRGSKRGKSV